MKKLFYNIPLVVYCIIFILGSFLAWCLLTISYQNSIFLGLSATINVGLMVIFSIIIKKSEPYLEIFNQFKTIIKIILCISVIISFLGFLRSEGKEDYFIAIMCSLWAIWACFISRRYMQKKEKVVLVDFNKGLKKYIGIIVLMILAILLAYEETGYQFKWDGLLYFNSCHNASLGSISSLALYGHISQTYAGLVALLKLIVGDVGVAMIVVNIILLVIAILSYYFLLKTIIPYKQEVFYLFATAILAFSPYFLGMVNYFSLDFCLICLFPMVLYFTFQEKWVYQLIVSLLFCFTKETAVIIYAGLCLGVFLFDLFSKKRKSISDIFKTKHYYTMIVPCVLWLFTFLLLGPWNAGESAVALDGSYIINKLKILYLFQFNWIFTVIIFFYLFLHILRFKKLTINKYIFALVISQVFFTIFSCIFKTVNHPRYIDSSIVFLYCIGTYCLTKIVKEKQQTLICAIISFVLLVSSYKSVDFISNYLFNQVDIGEDKIITTYDLPLGDGAIYNKQMLWMEGAINKALEDAIEAEDIIVVPAIDDSTYAFDGASVLTRTEGRYYVQCQYWNNIKKRREVIGSEDNQEYNLYHISDKAHIDIIPNPQNKNISYIYMESDDMSFFENNLKNANIIDEQNYFYRGWVLKRVVIQPTEINQ